MDLKRALRLKDTPECGASKPVRLAFVGAGGKTTALFALARQLSRPVWVTGSTHFATWQASLADHHIHLFNLCELEEIRARSLDEVLLITGSEKAEGRLSGLDKDLLNALHRLAVEKQVHLLIEADGSRQKPLKAPAVHEPALPTFVDIVVVVVGLSGLGKPLCQEWVHRPEIFSRLSGLSLGETISLQSVAKVLKHPQGGLKNIPDGARKVALLNQADTLDLQEQARRLAKHLLPVYPTVAISSFSYEKVSKTIHCGTLEELPKQVLFVHEPVAGVVLAAGESSRLGQPKQLLDWQGMPFIRKVTLTALESELNPVVVVTGAYGEQVQNAIKDLPVIIIHNPNWSAGQSTSIQAGLRAIPTEVGGSIFLLADQLQVPPDLLRTLVETHAKTLSPIVAPLVDGKQGNPMLFDRDVFPHLYSLNGDVGGRALLADFTPTWVQWSDSKLLLDVDTLEDYQRLMEM